MASGLWNTARKDIRRRLRDPAALLLTLAIPVALIGIMALAFGGFRSGKMPKATLALVDQDDTLVTRLLKGSFEQGPLPDLIEAVPTDSAQAMAQVRKGDISGVLIIPKGFTQAYLEGDSARLELIRNPAQSYLPSILEEVVATLAEGGFYVRELLGEPLGGIRGLFDSNGAPPDAAVAGISTSINRIMNRSARYVFPPVIELQTESSGGEEQAGPDFLTLFLPGMIIMSLLFVGQTLALDVWEEAKLGTLRRTAASPQPLALIFNGKVLGGGMVLLGTLAVLFVVARLVSGIPAAALIKGYFIALVLGLLILAFMHWLVLLPKHERGANLLSTLVIMPLALVGGCFFPVEAMPPSIRSIAVSTPTGWAVERVKDAILERPGGLWSAPLVLAVCAAGIAVFLILAQQLARRRVAS